MSNNIFKIRRKSDGLFLSNGGNYWTFNKFGKVWKKINHVKSHLTNNYQKDLYAENWKDLEVVEYEIKEVSRKDIEQIEREFYRGSKTKYKCYKIKD